MVIKDRNSVTHIVELDDGQPIFAGEVANHFVCVGNHVVESTGNCLSDDVTVTCEICQKFSSNK